MLLPPKENELEGDQGYDDDQRHPVVGPFMSSMLVKVLCLFLETREGRQKKQVVSKLVLTNTKPRSHSGKGAILPKGPFCLRGHSCKGPSKRTI